jgi:hypothetical protein
MSMLRFEDADGFAVYEQQVVGEAIPMVSPHLHFDQQQLSAGSPHVFEVRVRREDGDSVTQGIRGHEQVERLDGDAAATERVAEVSRLLPELPRIGEQMTARQ